MSKALLQAKPEEVRRRTRRSFLVAGVAAAAGAGLWEWLNHWTRIDSLNAPFRRVLDFNAAMARGLFREKAHAPEYSPSKTVPFFRRNGDIGLADLKLEDWRLQLVGIGDATSYKQFSNDVTSWMYGTNPSTEESVEVIVDLSKARPIIHEDDSKGEAVITKPMEMPQDTHVGIPGLLLTIEDIKRLPHVEMVTEFKCIEGWSEIVHWGGARFRDFLVAYPPHVSSNDDLRSAKIVTSLPEYIAFQTPDGQYYVGIEREVALHPQTLLAYELNGQPLTSDHGAPLRLVTPLKYGIKQIKQIGRITYTNSRPRDYWHEQGYDYYAGL
jgi:DMSO/TMAO reductase YedYZ molybdopterin-dependent catalytic subunit